MISEERLEQIKPFTSKRITWDIDSYRRAITELLAERKQLVYIARSWNAGIHHKECAACQMVEKPFEDWKENHER